MGKPPCHPLQVLSWKEKISGPVRFSVFSVNKLPSHLSTSAQTSRYASWGACSLKTPLLQVKADVQVSFLYISFLKGSSSCFLCLSPDSSTQHGVSAILEISLIIFLCHKKITCNVKSQHIYH